jgi:hypothetical protein
MLVALTVELKVDVPVLVSEILPKPCAPPTAPVKVIFAVPTESVKFLAAVTSLSTVELNKILLFVVDKLTFPANDTASLYDCVPEVVTLPVNIVEPPVSVLSDVALTVELNVVVPVELTATAPRVPLVPAPTEEPKLTFPASAFMVKVLLAADTPPPDNMNAEAAVELSV